MKPVSIVTIKNFSPMYKDGEEASNIQIANVEEHAFDVVVAKDLYKVGDKAVFIQPDYCLSDLPLFESYTKPEGNPKKSRLGKNNRVRAVKFGFLDSRGNKVYSNGILLPFKEVNMQLDNLNQISNLSLEDQLENLTEILGITKYEEPEKTVSGDSKGKLPSGLYKTDEENILNLKNKFEEILPQTLVVTTKVDGSSCTAFYKNENEFGITSRSLEKKLTQSSYAGFTKYYDKSIKKLVWRNEETNELVEDIDKYFSDNDLEVHETVSDSIFVKLAMPILDKLKEYGKPLAVRGEIYGQSLKGSGNKNNPHAKLDQGFIVYGIDDFSTGTAIPLPMNEVIELCKELELDMVPIIFNKEFNTFDELNQECLDYFSENMVEGVVVRTFDNNSFSAKLMNLEYDSKK